LMCLMRRNYPKETLPKIRLKWTCSRNAENAVIIDGVCYICV